MFTRRRSYNSLSSSGEGSVPQSLEMSQGDSNASQHSLGENASSAMVAFGGLGLVEESNEEIKVTGESKEEDLQIVCVSTKKETTDMSCVPSLVIEGIIAQDYQGVCYGPQKNMYAYCSTNSTHKKKVDNAIKKTLSDLKKVPDCTATRFKTVVSDYSGLIPTVVGGLSQNYKVKNLPTGGSSGSVEVQDTRASKRKRN